jgi:hypothetical protein
LAAILLPALAAAQVTYTTLGGGCSFEWTVGALNANQVYVDVTNTSPAGSGIGAMAFWLPNATLAPTAMSVGPFGGTTGGGATPAQWDKDISDWTAKCSAERCPTNRSGFTPERFVHA